MALKRNLIANYLGQGWTVLMGLAFIPLYIKYLGIEAYGVIGLYAVLQAWLGLLDMGMTPALGREMARFTGGAHSPQSIRDLLRSIEWIVLGIALLMAAIVWAASGWLARDWLRAEQLPVTVVAQAFAIMGLVTALRFVEGVYRSSLAGLQRQVMLNSLSAIMATLRGLGAIGVLIWVAPTLEAFFLWQAAVSVVTILVMAGVTYRLIPSAQTSGRFCIQALQSVWRFAGGMLSVTFLSLLLMQTDKIVLSKVLTLEDYGYYSFAGLVAGGVSYLSGPINQAWYPKLTELNASKSNEGFTRLYHQGAQLISVIVGGIAVPMIFYSEEIIRAWTQDNILANRTSGLVSILLLGNLLNATMTMPFFAQLAHGWTSLSNGINLISVLCLIPAVIWGATQYGAEGAAWIWVCLNGMYVLLGIPLMHRKILRGEKFRWYTQDVLLPIMASSLAVFLVKSAARNLQLNEMIVFGIALFFSVSLALLVCAEIRRAVIVRLGL